MKPWLDHGDVRLYHGDVIACLEHLPPGSCQTCVTSPPYWGLRDYGQPGQIGLEPSPAEYVDRIVQVFRSVWRVLRDDGTLWLNLGDSYTSGGRDGFGPQSGKQQTNVGSLGMPRAMQPPGLKPKDLVGIPWRVAFALQADGWYLRSDIIWSKPNPMPESVTDRPTKAHEYVFLLSKRPRYFYDADAIREPHESTRWGGRHSGPNTDDWKNGSRIRERDDRDHYPDGGRNARSVWEIATQPFPEAHFATYPAALVRRCILAGSREGDTVLDPFVGSGTTAHVARKHGRHAIGIDLNSDYLEIAARRLQQLSLLT